MKNLEWDDKPNRSLMQGRKYYARGVMGIQHVLLSTALAFMTLVWSSATVVSAKSSSQPLLQIEHGWQLRFEPASATLECSQPATGTSLKGHLSFMADEKGKHVAWSILAARDFAAHRLTIVDTNDNVRGFVMPYGEAGQFTLCVQPSGYSDCTGELCYEPEVRLGGDAFACRTRVPASSVVVQMASGPADSQLNDSIFEPNPDRLLRFGGKCVSITTVAAQTGLPAIFRARLTTQCPPTDATAITCELISDYYRSRYVPNYHLIDRKRCPSPPTGWMAWNTYFDQATETDVLAEAHIAAQSLKPFGLDIWSIESWQENSPDLPVKDFHHLTLKPSQAKFPHGMKWMADQIKSLGFRPGIWTVPWGTGDQKYYEAHRTWFLHKPDGTPFHNWCGRYLLDPSQPEVRHQMENAYRTMSAEWGYEFFKVDGITFAQSTFSRSEVQAAFKVRGGDPYPLCIEALRKGIGPGRILLACVGSYTGAEVAWTDATRTGADIVLNHQPPLWERGYRNQALSVLRKLFTHNLIWYNDPDTLLVGEFAPLNMARIATTAIALPGQVTFFGDKLGALPPERMRLLQQTLPVCDVRPLDLAPLDDLKPIWDLKVWRPFGKWDVVSLFNWGDEPGKLRFAFADLGLEAGKEYLVYEFWSQQFFGVQHGEFSTNLAPRSNLLLAIHENLGRPQLISTDRHITQGGVEWVGETWNQELNELKCVFKLVANDPLTAVIHVPSSYKLAAATAEGATVETRTNDSIAFVNLWRNTSGEVRSLLTFNHNNAR